MEHYDPDRAIDPEEWNQIDKSERQYLVERYHEKKRIEMPNSVMHALIHVVVENQVAMGSEIPAQETLARLMSEGLSRHDAIHAIGSIVAERIFNLTKGGPKGADVNGDYNRQLKELTAESWLNSLSEEAEEEG
jgi:hypothetical protein